MLNLYCITTAYLGSILLLCRFIILNITPISKLKTSHTCTMRGWTICWAVPAVKITPVSHARHLDIWPNRGTWAQGLCFREGNLGSCMDLRNRNRNSRWRMITRNSWNSCTNMWSKWRLEWMFEPLLYADICTSSECFLWSTPSSAHPIRTHAPVIAAGVRPLNSRNDL